MGSKVSDLTRRLKDKAKELGFYGVAIAKAEYMEEEARGLEAWLNQNYQGEMHHLSNHFDIRVDPTKLIPGAKSVICLMYNYYTPVRQSDEEAPKMSMYAYGRDYHKVVRKKLKHLLTWMKEEVGDINGRGFVDSAPILERDWAKRSGLGWVGKNTLLLNKNKGSYYFLAELICDVKLEYDTPVLDHCGTCTRCIEACPTDAISEKGYVMDGSKCISYLNIELKGKIPQEFDGKMDNWMFGCDICQDVCPWNKFSKKHKEEQFEPKDALINMRKKDWEEITEELFDDIFFGSAVKRAQFKGLKRNIDFLK